MAEIDVFELREQLRIERIKMIKNLPLYYPTIAASIFQLSNAIFAEDASLKMLCITSVPGFLLGLLKYADKKNPTIYQMLSQIIEQTSSYKECLEEYKKFIKELAYLTKRFDIKNPKEVIIFYEELLTRGYLSKNYFTYQNNHIYHNFKYELNALEEMSGARVLSGKSVCRHQSLFLINLLTELGFKACNISVEKVDIKRLEQLAKKNAKQHNHSIVGIEEEKSKYMFDCTANTFVSGLTSSEIKDKYKIYGCKAIETKEPVYYYISKEQTILNTETKSERVSFELKENFLVDPTEISIIRKEIEEKIDNNESLIREFYLSQMARIDKITELESQICPHSDSPILEWKIKK